MKKIPIDPSLSADQEVRFQTDDRSTVTLRFTYNVRSKFWFLDVTVGGTTVTGVKLVPGWPLLRQYKGLTALTGDFLFLPVSADARNYPTKYEDIGKIWFLCWLDESEISAWRSVRGLG